MSKAAEVSNTFAYSSLEGAMISCIEPTIQPMTKVKLAHGFRQIAPCIKDGIALGRGRRRRMRFAAFAYRKQ